MFKIKTENKMEVKLIIGIDPDNKKSGVALVANTTREVKVMKMDFPSLIDYLRECRWIMRNPEVVIEGGWLNKSNWHVLGKYMSAQKAAAIGRNAGMNHQTGILLEEYCKHLELDVKVVKPLKKCWRGQDGKITQEEAEYFMGKLPRMNQDQRDALLLAWVYAGLPVKVKPKEGGNAK